MYRIATASYVLATLMGLAFSPTGLLPSTTQSAPAKQGAGTRSIIPAAAQRAPAGLASRCPMHDPECDPVESR